MYVTFRGLHKLKIKCFNFVIYKAIIPSTPSPHILCLFVHGTTIISIFFLVQFALTLFRLGFFGVPGPGRGGGGGVQKPPLHKSESIDAVVMTLGG